VTRALAVALALLGCGGNADRPDPLAGTDALVFLQRQPRVTTGNAVTFSSYVPGARLVELSPPAADGELRVLCCETQGPDFAEIDISSFDVSYDAREIVFSGKLSADQSYGLFLLTVESREVQQLPTDPNRDYLHPVMLAGDTIMFVTQAVAEEGALQFRDESNRSTTLQLGTINRDGTEYRLGGRSLSHRMTPTALRDGRVMFAQWDHLGTMDQGSLLIANPDMTAVREAFGKEMQPLADFYLRPVEIAPGRVVAVAMSHSRTLQSGSLVDIRLGETYLDGDVLKADSNMAEANSSYRVLTPRVPIGRDPSPETVGRYYSAYPLGGEELPQFLVAWTDGPAHDPTLEEADIPADFGIYVLDSATDVRRPIWNDRSYWDLDPRPLAVREPPEEIQPSGKNEYSDEAVLMATVNVYTSTLGSLEPDSVYGMRLIEGFSTEEGFPGHFGATAYDGAAQLGVAPVEADGSYAALVPAGVPVQQQPLDRFGMALRAEPNWVSGAAGETRACAGCHEDRTSVAPVHPGMTEALGVGPVDLLSEVPRADRVSVSYTFDEVVGVPWDLAIQPILDANCVTNCHDGTAGPANPTWTVNDPQGGSWSWTFDLRGRMVSSPIYGEYPASYVSLIGPDPEIANNPDLVTSGGPVGYVVPESARTSELIRVLNPPQLFPEIDETVRAFETTPHGDVQGFTLTPDEYYLFILMADMGAQYFSRENKPAPN